LRERKGENRKGRGRKYRKDSRETKTGEDDRKGIREKERGK
jgi:hypothetical protein